ncbi:ROK family transcriptional regulator [Tessaracoccus caeni]|uniref:ROK family transcriptional regulator n=1 Tax=Tessaracoccus caeni TaxID=3031239 RepID=UPI0023DC4C65|nr:ROK family transcriptional regulator [Tessaracoccus caeni]MDF1489264.1 ROK family transcriptional regulator [Tessaracoccus caeni]
MQKRLLNSADVGETNRARVMRTLYRHGPLSRAALAAQLGVSRATITAIVTPMLQSRTLEELPQVAVTKAGGKPPKPLWFGEVRIGAIHLSETRVDVGLVSADGSILELVQTPFAAEPGEDERELLRARFDEVFGGQKMLGIGVGISGTVNTVEGRGLVSHRAPVATDYAVGPLLTSWYGVPAVVDLHPRVQCIGDQWFGLGRELDDFVSLFAGEVMGVGIVQDGRVTRGFEGAGGEAGHMVVDVNGQRCVCGRIGCWETVATLPWLREEGRRRGVPVTTVSGLAQLASSGDPVAGELFEAYGRMLGVGLANIEQLLGLGSYIVHGAPVQGGDDLRAVIERELVSGSPRRGQDPTVLFAEEPDQMTILGCAALVLSSTYVTV